VTRRLVLASGSPARLRLLRAAGFDPEVVVSGVPEDDVGDVSPRRLVAVLAERKANAVAPTAGDALVIGCDSTLDIDGVAHGKPGSAEEAVARWRRMRGVTGTLLTGHCLIDTRAPATLVDVAATAVRFGRPSDAEIDAYVATGEPLAVAGAFTLEGRSAPFIDGVDGDPSNVMGLSLPLLRRLLAQLGVAITDLWP
jgi:septum formation protein